MKTFIIEDKQRIESIILHCDACFVGITDLEGNPYVVPMNFGYENGVLYLHSGPEGSKLEMLLSGEYTISEIAYMTGFSSVAYFRQCFKNEYGMSPSGYVRQKQ